MNRKRLLLVLYISTRTGIRGIRLWRTNREMNWRLKSLWLGSIADWEAELLADRKWGRFFAW